MHQFKQKNWHTQLQRKSWQPEKEQIDPTFFYKTSSKRLKAFKKNIK